MCHHRLKGGSDHNAQTPSRQGPRRPGAPHPCEEPGKGNPFKNFESVSKPPSQSHRAFASFYNQGLVRTNDWKPHTYGRLRVKTTSNEQRRKRVRRQDKSLFGTEFGNFRRIPSKVRSLLPRWQTAGIKLKRNWAQVRR